MADVFISYKKEDAAHVERLDAALKAHQLDVWWDRELAGGQHFRSRIEQELAAAGAVVVVWSALSMRSGFVLDEANEANARRKLAPVTFEEGLVPPMGFREIQVHNLVGWTGDPQDSRIVSLVQSIDAIRRGRVAAALSEAGAAVSDAVRKVPAKRARASLANALTFVDFFGLPIYRLVLGALALAALMTAIWAVPAIVRGADRDWLSVALLAFVAALLARTAHQVGTILQGRSSRQAFDGPFSFWTCAAAIAAAALVPLNIPGVTLSSAVERFPFGFAIILVAFSTLRLLAALLSRLVRRAS